MRARSREWSRNSHFYHLVVVNQTQRHNIDQETFNARSLQSKVCLRFSILFQTARLSLTFNIKMIFSYLVSSSDNSFIITRLVSGVSDPSLVIKN